MQINQNISEEEKTDDQRELIQVQSQEAETELSNLFERQSQEMRAHLKQRKSSLKGSLRQNMDKYLSIWNELVWFPFVRHQMLISTVKIIKWLKYTEITICNPRGKSIIYYLSLK